MSASFFNIPDPRTSLYDTNPIFWSNSFLTYNICQKTSNLWTKYMILVMDFPCCYNCNFYGSVLVVAVDKYRTFHAAILFILQGLNKLHWWKFISRRYLTKTQMIVLSIFKPDFTWTHLRDPLLHLIASY